MWVYMSLAVADKVLEHYRNTRILKGRVASHGRFRHDGAAADTRRDGSARDGEPDAVLREFGGLGRRGRQRPGADAPTTGSAPVSTDARARQSTDARHPGKRARADSARESRAVVAASEMRERGKTPPPYIILRGI